MLVKVQRGFRGKEIALAKLTKQEQVKASLSIVHIFLGNIEEQTKTGSGYYCNKRKREYIDVQIQVSYENLNRWIVNNAILIKKWEYVYIVWKNWIAIILKVSNKLWT